MLGNRGFPEAQSHLCVCRSLLPHDLCHGRSSSCWLPAIDKDSFQENGLNYIITVVFTTKFTSCVCFQLIFDIKLSTFISPINPVFIMFNVGKKITSSNFWSFKSHGQRSLVGCSPWGHYKSGTTERLHFHFSLSCIGEGNGNLLQCSCLENPRDGGAWWASIYGVPQSRTCPTEAT